jgi:uncharacterized protein (DUF1330 family)
MSCYFLAQLKIHDRQSYEDYTAGFDEIFAKYDGEVLAVDEEPRILEGRWEFSRAVLIRFPSEEEANRWYSSVEYQRLASRRWKAAEGPVILMEGRQE